MGLEKVTKLNRLVAKETFFSFGSWLFNILHIHQIVSRNIPSAFASTKDLDKPGFFSAHIYHMV